MADDQTIVEAATRMGLEGIIDLFFHFSGHMWIMCHFPSKYWTKVDEESPCPLLKTRGVCEKSDK